MAVRIKGNVPHENSFCSVVNRTGITVDSISVRRPGWRKVPTPIDLQVIHPPLDVTPPISVKQSCTLGEVHFFRRERSLEFPLLINVSSVAMESGASELGSRLLENLDWVLAALVPVMLVRDNPRASKTIVVHQRSQCFSNVCLLTRGKFTGGICRVAVPRLVLDPDCVCSDSLVPESLQGLQ